MNMKDKYKINLLILTVTGFILRLLWILFIDSTPVSDFAAYQELAVSVSKNETSTFLGFQGPGYPLALGFYYKLIGSTDIFAAKIFNLILSTLTMIILLRVFTLLFNNKRYVYLCYAVVVFLPNYIGYTNILATESLNLFLFSLIVLLQISNKNSVLKYVLLGITIGLSSLVKPYMIIYPVISAFCYWLSRKNLKETFKHLVLVQLACLCIIAPWTYRNYKVYNYFVPISYNNGYVMYINNNDLNNGGWMPITKVNMTDETMRIIKEHGYTYEQAVSGFNPDLNNVFKGEAVKWIKKNPAKFAELAYKRVKYSFFNGADDIFTWAMNGNNTNNLFYSLLDSALFHFICNSLVIILSSCGFIFILVYALSILKAIFSKSHLIDYNVSIPLLNVAFSIMLSVVYEGQPRYGFNILFISAICLCVIVNNIKSFNKASLKLLFTK